MKDDYINYIITSLYGLMFHISLPFSFKSFTEATHKIFVIDFLLQFKCSYATEIVLPTFLYNVWL